MTASRIYVPVACLLLGFLLTEISCSHRDNIVRPEKIRSKREVIYDEETYANLARLWEDYYKEFPSEDAYGNWMYAARYAGVEDYEKLLERGLKRYPANPTLLYLSGMCRHGTSENALGRSYLERATQLDPEYMDPWFSLVGHYMEDGEEERLNLALRHLLEGGAIAEEIMDYNYNMLVGLAENAILITNGDNDTYPGWILTRVLHFRPDVKIVNRSLLNTDWYPIYIIKEGVPRFITKRELDELRTKIQQEMKAKKAAIGPGGPFGDTLIVRLIDAAIREGRPVYMSHTLYESDVVERYREKGRSLGLVSLVTPPTEPYGEELKKLFRLWLEEYRTGGLDSWRLRHAKAGDAALPIMTNYGAGLYLALGSAPSETREFRLDLFRWYQKHLADLLPQNGVRDTINRMWCGFDDIEEIQNWCRRQGHIK